MSVTPAAPLELPTTADVAAILRARTKDLDGAEVGDFTDNTRPTGTEVDRLIAMAYAEVSGQVGTNLYEPCASSARTLIAVRAAMWVELSYWPEQVRSDRSAYAELEDQWTASLPALIACVEGNLPGAGGESPLGYRFGTLDVHGWTSSPYYGTVETPLPVEPPPDG